MAVPTFCGDSVTERARQAEYHAGIEAIIDGGSLTKSDPTSSEARIACQSSTGYDHG